jgi:alpha-L-fucosidase
VRALAALLAALVVASPAAARRPQAPFGIFIHYGPSSVLNADSTESWMRAVWDTSYPQLAAQFHPDPQVVAQWVAVAKAARATYITFTAKHHDGFTLWHTTGETDTAAGAANWSVSSDEDMLAALAPACRAAHLKLYVYYSLPDWYSHWYRVQNADRFVPIMENQLTEILTRYGPLAGVWLDGTWDRPATFWHLDELIALIHRLQPAASVGVNTQPPIAGEDFAIVEQALPARPAVTPTEVVYPLGAQWFYSTADAPQTHAWVLALRRRAAQLRVRLLLDVPPRPDGTFDPAYVRALLGP